MGFKVFIFLMAFFVIGHAKPRNFLTKDNVYEGRVDFLTKKIMELLDKLREQMKTGDPEKGIPPMDPLYIAKLSLGPTQIEDLLQLNHAIFENVTIQKLPTFVVEDIKANILSMKVDFHISFHEIIINGWYDIDGNIKNVLPIYGNGAFYVGLFDLHVLGSAVLGSKDGKVFLETLKLDAHLGHLAIHMEGLLGGGDLGVQMNALLQSMGTEVVNSLLSRMSGTLSDMARNKINEVIKDFDFGGIIG